jgi:hypothetical protein
MKRNPPLPYAEQYKVLRPEEKLILFAIVDETSRGEKTRRVRGRVAHNSMIILSYAGLLHVADTIDDPDFVNIRCVTSRGQGFHRYMAARTNVDEQVQMLPNGHPLKQFNRPA